MIYRYYTQSNTEDLPQEISAQEFYNVVQPMIDLWLLNSLDAKIHDSPNILFFCENRKWWREIVREMN